MTIYLAPMEGLLDFVLRDILTRAGGIDRCVSEFIRISNSLLSEKAILRTMPELAHGSRTRSGVVVWPQLLGSDPICLADNAARLADMGALGIDLNFGCPAKVVNRHGGGAALLQNPEQLMQILRAVRAVVPKNIPVSAKMRLGYEDDSLAVECAQALVDGGASELVVHARTKAQGYRPPAYWERVQDIRAGIGEHIPVAINGEIWTVEDAIAARTQSGCTSLMLGRGIVANPALALEILGQSPAWSWDAMQPLLRGFWDLVRAHLDHRQQTGRLKQWLKLLRNTYPQAEALYTTIREIHDPLEIRWD